MTDEGIRLEYETCLADEGHSLNTCSKCGYKTHQGQCPECVNAGGEHLALSGDSVVDQAMAMTDAGETFDLERALRYGEFEPVVLDEVEE